MKRRFLGKAAWSFLLVLALAFLAGDSFGAGDPIAHIARSHLYSVARWEVGNVTKKWVHAFGELFPGSQSQEEKVQDARRFFDLTTRINALKSEASRGGTEPQGGLAPLLAERKRLEPSVERTLEGMISSALKENGVSSRLLLQRFLWPPVDFRLDVVPKVLIVSPRDRIELAESKLLNPELTTTEIERLEATIDGRDLSSLVEGLGGVATYPSLVPEGSSLQTALNMAAHEWTHHYLFFHPLGQGYRGSGDMTTINETVADIVGKEIGRAVYRRYFASPEELEPAPTPTPGDTEAPSFDLNKELRETRLMAERLLEEGKIEEAESYMEERRLFLADNGHHFRKINQAFFAFHGTYAERPGSVSPIGGQIRTLREQSVSLGKFLGQVARYSSYDALKRDLGLSE